MTKRTDNEQLYRYSQLATAYTFTKAMEEAGVEDEKIVDVNWIANTIWNEIMERYHGVIRGTPANTRQELSDLEYVDLAEQFRKLSDQINVRLFGPEEEE